MPITADGALKNTIIVGKNQRKPIYKFTNAQLTMGSIRGTFNSNIISNELPIDTFSFTVNYDDEGNQVYLTSDTNQAYVCVGSVPGTLETSGMWSNNLSSAIVSGNTIRIPDSPNISCNFEFWRPGTDQTEEYWFRDGDVLRIGIDVEHLQNSNTSVWVVDGTVIAQYPVVQIESQTGLFNLTRYHYGRITGLGTKSVGHDVITYTITNNVRTIKLETINSVVNNEIGATIKITGIEFNGQIIYGNLNKEYSQPPLIYILSNRDKTPASEYLRNIKYGTPVWWYCNHKFMAKGYYKGNTRTSRTTWKLDAMSAIGKLDEKIHVGGIYTGQTFKSVLTEICGNTCRFEFDEGDEALENLQVFGWLPYDTARNNLHRLLFAMGASIKKVNVT